MPGRGKLPSVMGHKFSEVPQARIPRSSFDRSFGHKTTFDAGWLVPFYVDEALPGDTFNLRTTAFARLATPLKPIMDNLFLDTFFFAVPNRLLWDNWEKFNGAQDDPGDSTDFTVPLVNSSADRGIVGTLNDYFGLDSPTVTNGPHVNALPWRAYNLIWNEWFRDQNLQDSAAVHTGDSIEVSADYPLRRRGKRHDYFTSCLPWPQKGTAVQMPLGTEAPVTAEGTFGDEIRIFDDVGTYRNLQLVGGVATGEVEMKSGTGSGAELYADLTASTAGATINELRQSFQIQKLLERDARGGTRYTEIVKAHFGVTSPDSRMQRPEYLGGGSTPVNISPIANTAGDDGGAGPNTAIGDLAGIGTAHVSGHGFVKSFTEHCTIIGLVCVRADLTYQQGIERMWFRSTRYDYYWPALAHIGEQAVYNREIYAVDVDSSPNTGVFGYQERYAEYRYKPSIISGLFRSGITGSLDIWHLSQEFGALPTLDDTFIQENPPLDRVIAVPTEPHFIFDSYTRLKCARPMPVYGVPGMIDHF